MSFRGKWLEIILDFCWLEFIVKRKRGEKSKWNIFVFIFCVVVMLLVV